MGLEAQALCRIGATGEPVKALLESTQLVLRGATIRRRFERPELQHLCVRGSALQWQAGDETVVLELGAALAQKWLLKLQTPPPTLAAKLGIGPDKPAAVLGMVDDAALHQALEGATTDDLSLAVELLAVVHADAELQQAVQRHAGMSCRGLWVVHEKGSGAALGDVAIRQALRGQGYKDVKTTAVSGRYTATRYLKPGAG